MSVGYQVILLLLVKLNLGFGGASIWECYDRQTLGTRYPTSSNRTMNYADRVSRDSEVRRILRYCRVSPLVLAAESGVRAGLLFTWQQYTNNPGNAVRSLSLG